MIFSICIGYNLHQAAHHAAEGCFVAATLHWVLMMMCVAGYMATLLAGV